MDLRGFVPTRERRRSRRLPARAIALDQFGSDDIRRTLGLDGSPGDKEALRQRAAMIAGAALFVFALLWYALGTGGAEPVTYRTVPAARGPLVVTVTSTGTVEPTSTVEISSELSGTIRQVLVDHNDRVIAGQELAYLDTDRFEAQARRSRAAVQMATAKVREAEATLAETGRVLQRKERLSARDFSSQAELEAARAAYERAQAVVGSAEADVAVAEADHAYDRTTLEKACICTPVEGVVLQRNVDPGQTVASSLQAPTLFVIAEDLEKMELEIDVDEADVSKVKAGQQAHFTVDAHDDWRFPAVVSLVRYGSETVEGVVTYKAILTVDNSELLLRPGMTATAEIVVAEIDDALLVPNAALRFDPSQDEGLAEGVGMLESIIPRMPKFRPPSTPETGSERTVWTLVDGQPVAVRVVIGTSDGSQTEILEGGLKAGDPLIVDAVAGGS